MRYPSGTCMAKSTAYQTHDPLQTQKSKKSTTGTGHVVIIFLNGISDINFISLYSRQYKHV